MLLGRCLIVISVLDVRDGLVEGPGVEDAVVEGLFSQQGVLHMR